MENNNQIAVAGQHVLHQAPAFKDTEDKVFNVVLASVAKSYRDLNFQLPSQNDVKILVTELTANIRDRFKSIRTSEIPVAFADGIREEYGKFMGLSVITFENFLKGYMESQKRKDLVKNVPALEAPTQPSQAEKLNTATKLALIAYDIFKQGKSILLQGATVYRFLSKIKVFEYTDEEKELFITEARQQILDEKILQKATASNKFIRNEINKQLEDTNLLEQKIVIRAQHNGLIAFFQTVEIEEINLKELIEAKGREFL